MTKGRRENDHDALTAAMDQTEESLA